MGDEGLGRTILTVVGVKIGSCRLSSKRVVVFGRVGEGVDVGMFFSMRLCVSRG